MTSTSIVALLLVLTATTLAQSTVFVTPVPVSETSDGPTSTLDSSSATSSSCTICADYVNDCGIEYGGCFEACSGEPWPSFTPPPCPTNSTTTPSSIGYPDTSTVTTSNTASTITSAPVYLSPYGSNSTCDKVICVDYINTCDIKYGGCFPALLVDITHLPSVVTTFHLPPSTFYLLPSTFYLPPSTFYLLSHS
ncbi:uncharacterized protein MYCFIDRAFT_83965 [Pseudocercospora fijiensis CIRAD86]|uniref:Uncharacterized protein n=1 Tax=Pseudocercospora fijiensis (strain CIRAD86) TaxID=383855 RepID=M3AH90_PSEFD|nr:uncharacterized protein MYCFIDRAFT_83965 [Pseudocercospora fijiensis CIRAD86]EME76867.1 hypothetical protein MYCFIDRAFT_83965 [Pseudocercospora fijiensis CIRAD86]